MMEFLVSNLPVEVTVLLVAALPVVELRGAIPLGLSLGMGAWEAWVVSVAGSLLPVGPLLVCLEPLCAGLRRWPAFRRPVERFLGRMSLRGEKIRRYGLVGLVMFTAIPLPSTGTWSASVVASLLGVPVRQAFPAIAAGSALAGIIVVALSLLGRGGFQGIGM